ncbi:flagellar basal-body MS-ring/collar protein FliF [Lentibacillus sediminis]|uniref:flagellar basal-body MS-ring/collar protein FliF n=1 Tax=Lentibacillus sediminis TaxID=1940529 RepID=UPI000C1BE3F6|nr:flagellar basal-body MS-ring/collar protein FliF [Lentibacillus sediminis]
MKEKMIHWKDAVFSYWKKRSRTQKGTFIGSVLIVILLIAGVVIFTAASAFVPLYSNLSMNEVGQIKAELDARGVAYEITDGGTTIHVPEEQVDGLLVDLASQGIPNSGNIDYSFFSENTSWGITDNEFNIMRLDAMQTELANLIQGIEGIGSAEVMLNMPEEPVFVNESAQEASASIVINTQPGYQFQGNQINGLYHLISKAVPNLPPDNIVVMNQYSEYYDRNTQTGNGGSPQNVHTYQQQVKDDIERDLKRRLQQMLGAMVGMENVIVSVTSDIDFTQENRTEELVEPVDIENMEGLPVSIETVQETYSGNPPVGGEGGTGEGDVPNYPADAEGTDGEYELERETINNEFNRIRREIVESPYKVRDIGVQVAIDQVQSRTSDEIEYLTQQEQNTVEAGISSILDSIISTTIGEEFGDDLVPEEKFSIVFQEFSGDPDSSAPTSPGIPGWLYAAGAALILIIIILAILLFRNRKTEEEYVEEAFTTEPAIEQEVPGMEEPKDSESVIRRKQLENIAKDNPEEFAKLLRSWITED